MGQDWGLTFKPQIKTDSSSAKGILARRGAGKLRHIETPFLWLQQVAMRRQLEILKVAGVKNEADLGTKILDAPAIRRILGQLHLSFRAGEHGLALKAAT